MSRPCRISQDSHNSLAQSRHLERSSGAVSNMTPLLTSVIKIANRWNDEIAPFRTALRLSSDVWGAHCTIGTALLFQGKWSSWRPSSSR